MKRLLVFGFVFMLAMAGGFGGTKMPAAEDASPFSTLCEAVDNCKLTWTTGGSAHWFAQTGTVKHGNSAAQSGAIGDSQSTHLQTTVIGPGTLKFQWKVSSELYFDYLSFYIDGDLQTGISGEVDWTQSSDYTIPVGTHTLKWEYSKDFAYYTGSDCGWVDQVEYTPETAIVLSRAQLVFGAAPGTVSGAQTFTVRNNADDTLNWSVTADQNWLSVTPVSGTNLGVVTVSVDTTGLSTGIYNGSVIVSGSNAFNSPQTVAVTLNIYGAGGSAVPFGDYSTPADGAVIRSSVPFTGWVLDDVGVESVKLYRQDGNSLFYIGDAMLVEGARPDVEQQYPDYPGNGKAGWGYMMLTNFLPNGGNGTFTIKAIATDLEGQQASLGTKTVTVDNAGAVKPFGAIDTPAPGETVSGPAYGNKGWVLTPLPNTVPTDGTTINVYVDGEKLEGHAVYGMHRADIAGLLPGYNNSDGAQASFEIDTTAYQNGVHTIMWVATDNAGNEDGIGSRYFTINNAGNPRRGTYEGEQGLGTLPSPGHGGIVTVEIKELERIRIHFGPGKQLSGWMVVGDKLRNLPIGSTLDRDKGIFYWQAGPGFRGEYRLVFMETDAYGNVTKRAVLVRIDPKF
ncbi:MAG: BACON domain-containing protein [bacterium]|nr:BACON domain-containing protein [bacterium]